MRVFLTGGSGFVGSGILSELLRNGYEVQCLVRRGSAISNAHAASGGLLTVEGDLLRPETYERALEQCDAVIHLVGIIREGPRHGVTFDAIHTKGTKAIIDACVRAGYARSGKRFIHMSALGARPGAASAYFRSKGEAEEQLRRSGIPFVIFRPSVIFGPEDDFVNMLANLVKLPVTPVIGDGRYRLQPVSLRTVSEVFVKALTYEALNTSFDVGGPDMLTYNEMLREIGRAMNRSVRLIHQPLWLMKPVISLFERFPFFPITGTQLSMLLEESICRDGTPFYKAYQAEPIPFADGIREYIRP